MTKRIAWILGVALVASSASACVVRTGTRSQGVHSNSHGKHRHCHQKKKNDVCHSHQHGDQHHN